MGYIDKVALGSTEYDLADNHARASLAPIETSPATAAHAVGELITVDGVLYRVTAAIAVGDTIKATGSSGVNIKAATVQTERDWVQHIATNAASGQIVFMEGRYRTADAAVDLFNPGASSSAATHCALVPCKAGDSFYATVTTGGTAAMPWCVCAADGTVLYKASSISTTGIVRIYDTSAGRAAWIVFNWKQTAGDGKYAARMVGGVIRITITDTEATIVAVEDGYYAAAQSNPLTSLSFTPSSTGLCEVRFTTGTTPTALTVPSGIKWPDWFNPSSLAASTTYDIMVKDGTFGAVMTWA